MFVISLDIFSFIPVSPRPREKCFLRLVFAMGRARFFHNDTKINRKDKGENGGSKEGFLCFKFSQVTFKRQVHYQSVLTVINGSGKGVGWGC